MTRDAHALDPARRQRACQQARRLFHAKVTGTGAAAALTVEPIERGITYRQLQASEITDHWAHAVATSRQDRPPAAQTALDLGAQR